MTKKALLIALTITASIWALPTFASANWSHNSKELTKEASITLQGELKASGTVGSVSCPTELSASLTPSSSTGSVTSLTVKEPSKCDVGGNLNTQCGTNSVTKVEKFGAWEFSTNGKEITLSNVDFQYSFGGCVVPGIRLKGTVTATVNYLYEVGKMTPSGSLSVYNAANESLGSTASISGPLSVSPSSTYGVVVPKSSRWTKEGKQLETSVAVKIKGTVLSLAPGVGGWSCPVEVVFHMFPVVREDGAEGYVESYVLQEPKCHLTGSITGLCIGPTLRSMKLTPSFPWKVTTDGKVITFGPSEIEYLPGGCFNTVVTGNFVFTPDNAKAMKSLSLNSAVGSSMYGPMNTTGSLTFTAPGIYGIY